MRRLPFRRAEVGATDEALPVVTEGAELVRKEASDAVGRAAVARGDEPEVVGAALLQAR